MAKPPLNGVPSPIFQLDVRFSPRLDSPRESAQPEPRAGFVPNVAFMWSDPRSDSSMPRGERAAADRFVEDAPFVRRCVHVPYLQPPDALTDMTGGCAHLFRSPSSFRAVGFLNPTVVRTGSSLCDSVLQQQVERNHLNESVAAQPLSSLTPPLVGASFREPPSTTSRRDGHASPPATIYFRQR